MKKVLLSLMLFATVFVACKDDKGVSYNIFKGPEAQVHGGKAWTWIQLDSLDKPMRLGVSLTDKALNSLPSPGVAGHGHDNPENNWALQLPSKAANTPFNHLGMNWNPAGHEPEPIYGKPHFDFHFYMITTQEVAAIPAYDIAPEKFDNIPAPSYFPSTYVNTNHGIAQMGAHWVDVTSSEFKGKPFGETFILGSYDGKVTFYEPMITLEFLKNNSNFERSIPLPARFQKSGYYPTKIKVVKHDGLTDVILDEFVYREQS